MDGQGFDVGLWLSRIACFGRTVSISSQYQAVGEGPKKKSFSASFPYECNAYVPNDTIAANGAKFQNSVVPDVTDDVRHAETAREHGVHQLGV